MERNTLFHELHLLGAIKDMEVNSVTFSSSQKATMVQTLLQVAREELRLWDQGNKKESMPGMYEHVKRYWKEGAGLSASHSQRQIEERAASIKAKEQPKHPWSAAFVSYVMRRVYPDFRPSAAHNRYIAWAKENRRENRHHPFYAYRPGEVAVEVGDIICNPRGKGLRATYDNIEQNPLSHGDIVIGISGHEAKVVGGNVIFNVKTKKIPLASDGKLLTPESYFAIVKMMPIGGVRHHAGQTVTSGAFVRPSQAMSADQPTLAMRLMAIVPVAAWYMAETVLKLNEVLSRGGHENQITDILFYAIHRDAPRKLEKQDPRAQHWLQIRRQVGLVMQGNNAAQQVVKVTTPTAMPQVQSQRVNVSAQNIRDIGNGKLNMEAASQIAQTINEYAPKFGINTPLRMAHFLGQASHETDNFRAKTERLTYTSPQRLMEVWPKRFPSIESATPFLNNPVGLGDKVYSGRLGNNQPGDGHKYRGRGILQITGKENYKKLTDDFRKFTGDTSIDFVKNPDMVAQLPYGIISAMWFFKRRELNELADRDDIERISLEINGYGYRKSLAARRAKVEKVKKILRV